MITKVLLLLLCSGYLSAQIVQIPDGQIRGRTQRTVAGKTFYQFLGIPFAQPPVNQLRFQAPRPALPWNNIIDGTYEKSPCWQIQYNYPAENEDCLFLNVHTPTNPAAGGNLPVMVWIYGGGFIDGYSQLDYFAPHSFMDRDVILVTFNYRVGAFGFFSTGDNAIPGNAGLKDQNLALQWVQKNIKFFGGDPAKVTLFGESAGAASVGYHLLSPKSRGLFRAAILESGSALTPWAYQRDQKAITYKTASYINPNAANMGTYDLLQYLQNVPAQQIKQATITQKNTEGIQYQQIRDGFFYAPVVEHDHPDAFITKMMYESMATGDIARVPIIIGMNSGEALLIVDPSSLGWMAGQYDQNHALLDPLDMHIRDDNARRAAGEAIKNIYAPGSSFQANPNSIVSYLNDQCFMRSIIKHAEFQAPLTDVYFYQFSYTGILGGYSQQSIQGFTDQVRHAEELNYLFAHTYAGQNTTDLSRFPESDRVVFNRFVTLFTNFAKTLNPTPQPEQLLENIIWPKVTTSNFQYLDIGSYSQIRSNPRQSTYRGWSPVYSQYGQRPFDTY